MLDKAEIQEFQKIYKEVYGKEISQETAEEYGENLVKLMKSLYEEDKYKNKLNKNQYENSKTK
jgi:hypothetical protein